MFLKILQSSWTDRQGEISDSTDEDRGPFFARRLRGEGIGLCAIYSRSGFPGEKRKGKLTCCMSGSMFGKRDVDLCFSRLLIP